VRSGRADVPCRPARRDRIGARGVPFGHPHLTVERIQHHGEMLGDRGIFLAIQRIEQIKLFFLKTMEFPLADHLPPRSLQRPIPRSTRLINLCLIPITFIMVNVANAQNRFAVPGTEGAVVLRGRIDGKRIGPKKIKGAYRAIETEKDGAEIKNLVIDGLVAEQLQREGIRLRGAVENVTIRNFTLTHSATPNVPPHLPEGIHIQAGRNIVIENGTISGFQMTMPPDKYWNGDGIATEKTVDGVTIRNVTSNDNTDAGFDLKSSNTTLDRVSASGNKRNFRFWESTKIGTMTVGEIVKRGGAYGTAGIWIKGHAGKPPVIEIDTLIVRLTQPGTIIQVEDGPAEIRIGRCDIQAPAGSRFLAAGDKQMKKTLGPGCRV